MRQVNAGGEGELGARGQIKQDGMTTRMISMMNLQWRKYGGSWQGQSGKKKKGLGGESWGQFCECE